MRSDIDSTGGGDIPATSGPVPGRVLAVVASSHEIGWAIADRSTRRVRVGGAHKLATPEPFAAYVAEVAQWLAATIEDAQPSAVVVPRDGYPTADAGGTLRGVACGVAVMYGRELLSPMATEWQPGVCGRAGVVPLYEAATGRYPWGIVGPAAYALAHWYARGRALTLPATD